MPNTKPCVVWGDSFQYTLLFKYALVDFLPYADTLDENMYRTTVNGAVDVWFAGQMQLLEGDVIGIPNLTTSDQSGWDDAWKPFLRWAQKRNSFYFYPDANVQTTDTHRVCYLIEPMQGAPDIDNDGTKKLHLKLKTVDGTAF